MGSRRLYFVLAGLLGAAAGVVPSLAAGASPPTTASFTAVDYSWDANGGSGSQVTIAAGGTVDLGYPSGADHHNADFGSGPQPTSCTQTAGTSSGAVPPLPNQPTSPGWTGTCTFNTPGTYTFHCDLHPFMTGTVVVDGPGGTTTGTTTTTTTPPTSTTNTQPTLTEVPPPTEPEVPITPQTGTGHPASGRVSIPSRQRGNAVTGVVDVSPAGTGGRLEVVVFAASGSVHGHAARRTEVGRFVRTNLRAGRVRFKVPVNAKARRALRARGQLALTVVVSIRSAHGGGTSMTRRVRLRSPRPKLS